MGYGGFGGFGGCGPCIRPLCYGYGDVYAYGGWYGSTYPNPCFNPCADPCRWRGCCW